jgi:DNA-binding protein HU-beta
MRKVELVARIAARTALTRTQAEEAVEAILATIKEGLQQGEPVSLRGLGTFHVRAKRAHGSQPPDRGCRRRARPVGGRFQGGAIVQAGGGGGGHPGRGPRAVSPPGGPGPHWSAPAHGVPRRTRRRARRARADVPREGAKAGTLRTARAARACPAERRSRHCAPGGAPVRRTEQRRGDTTDARRQSAPGRPDGRKPGPLVDRLQLVLLGFGELGRERGGQREQLLGNLRRKGALVQFDGNGFAFWGSVPA